MEVLSSRILVRPRDQARSRAFYRDQLGLAIYRQFGDPADPGTVFFAGPGFVEVSAGPAEGPAAGRADTPAVPQTPALWLQVRDVAAEHVRLRSAGVPIRRAPRQEPWGLVEMWLDDPDGLPVVLVEIPADHPLRRDQRSAPDHEAP